MSVGGHQLLSGEMNGGRVKAEDGIIADNLLSFEKFLQIIVVFVDEVG